MKNQRNSESWCEDMLMFLADVRTCLCHLKSLKAAGVQRVPSRITDRLHIHPPGLWSWIWLVRRFLPSGQGAVNWKLGASFISKSTQLLLQVYLWPLCSQGKLQASDVLHTCWQMLVMGTVLYCINWCLKNTHTFYRRIPANICGTVMLCLNHIT